MNFSKYVKKADFYFLFVIILLLGTISGVYLYEGKQEREAELTESQQIAQSIEQSSRREAESALAAQQALDNAHAMRPSNDLTAEQIDALDNTDLNFWFTPSVPSTKARNIAMPELVTLSERYDAFWIGPDNQSIYLTMDLAYDSNDHVNKILDIAKEHNIKLNFFLTGEFLANEPDKVKRIYNEGHFIGNRTLNQLRGPEVLSRSKDEYIAEIKDLETKFSKLTGGQLAPYVRPTNGVFSERTLALNENLGYYTVFWSFAYVDWDMNNQPTAEAAFNEIKGQFHNGEILLLSVMSNTNIEILPRIIEEATKQGYQFKRLDERFLN